MWQKWSHITAKTRIVSEAIRPFAVEAQLNASEDVANRYEELLQTQILFINNNSFQKKSVKSNYEFLEDVIRERKQMRRS